MSGRSWFNLRKKRIKENGNPLTQHRKKRRQEERLWRENKERNS